jgi:peroxiredoxin
MKRQTVMLTLVALCVLGLFSAFTLSPDEPTVKLGKAVPDFSLTDIHGKMHKLSDYKGKVVVLEWTNPNCPFVERVYRDGIMTGVQKKYAEKVVWLTINSTNKSHQDYRKPEELAKTYADWKAAYSAYLMDTDGTVGKMFDARTTPHMYIINKEGVLVYAGAIDSDPRGNKSEKTNYVAAALDELLAGKQITTALTTPYGCTVKY